MSNNIKDETLSEVSGGSWFITEEDGRNAGLELRREDGTAGSWGYLYNEGDYYWRGRKLTVTEANALVHYYADYRKQPDSLEDAVNLYRSF